MKWLAIAVSGLLALSTIAGGMGAALGQTSGNALGGFLPSQNALADIPSNMLPLYQAAGEAEGIDWTIIAGIGKVETDHFRSTAIGVHSGVNFAGCCAGPMQFNIRNGTPSTWDAYGAGGNVYDPADAIPAAARLLKAAGAPGDYHRAILAYNHSDAYVAQVMHWATVYRGAEQTGAITPTDVTGSGADVVADPHVTLAHPCERGDLLTPGREDPRVPAILLAIAEHHAFLVFAIKCDHHPGTNHNPSNGSPGRAVDIASVDGEICTGTRDGTCGRLAVELGRITGPLRSTELIYCFDPDGPADPRGFARADHCDHIHVGWDA